MKLCLTFEEYQNMLDSTNLKEVINKLVQDNLQGKLSDFFEREMKEPGKTIDQMPLVVRPLSEIFPVQASAVRDSKYCKVVTASYDSWINAFQSMQDPEHFAKVINIIDKKLGKENGEEYDIGGEDRILGLANRYAENAEQCKILYKWKDFNFYMSMLAYFLPFLVEKAGLNEADLAVAVEAKAKKIASECSTLDDIRAKIKDAEQKGNQVLVNRLRALEKHFEKKATTAGVFEHTDGAHTSVQINEPYSGVGFSMTYFETKDGVGKLIILSNYSGMDAYVPQFEYTGENFNAHCNAIKAQLAKLAKKQGKELEALLNKFHFEKEENR